MLAAALSDVEVEFRALPQGTHWNLSAQPGYADLINRFVDSQ
jgi:hypothetical protein